MSAEAAARGQAAETYEFESRGHWAITWRRFRRNRLAIAGLVTLCVLFTAGFLAKHIAPYGYLQLDLDALADGPSRRHLFGTDQLGRDYFSRILFGIGTEAAIALLVGVLGSLIGTVLGAVAGYFGGAVDNLLMRLTDVLLTLPPLLVLLVAAAYLHATTVVWIAVLMGCVLWMPTARVVRGRCLALREQEYVDAARAMGASDLRIVLRHVLPNTLGSVAVAATVMTAGAILLETTISYLGFGLTTFSRTDARTDARTPSLGDVIFVAKDDGVGHWWGATFAGIAIILILTSIYLVGDGLRDALDPVARRHVETRGRPRRRRRSPLLLKAAAVLPHPSLPAAPAFVSAVRTATGRALDRLSRRRARRRRTALRLLIEAVVVLAVTAVAAGAVYAWKVHPVASAWPVAGTLVQNISRAVGAQTEVSVARSATGALFAASNDTLMRTIRVHTSTDGGRSWSSSAGPFLGDAACARGDPAVAVAPSGRQYVAFTVNGFCNDEDPEPYLVVASNAGPRRPWTVRRVVPRVPSFVWDDKPALAVGRDERVHVVWSRLLTSRYETTVVSSSSDGGLSWARPRIVHRRLEWPQLVNAAVGSDGTLYVAGVDARFGIWIARARDAGGRFDLRRVARLPGNEAETCIAGAAHPIAEQADRCLGPNPTLAVTRNRVYVTYGMPIATAQHVSVAVFDEELRRLSRPRVIPSNGLTGEQFWPVSAVDPQTGVLWVCFYDTSGDESYRRAWFVCTVSRDGRTWARPVRAADQPANTKVLWEDARIFGFLDNFGFGGYPGLTVGNGVAHPLWIDTRDLGGRKQEIFAARIDARAFRSGG